MLTHIDGVPVSAPLFRNAPVAELEGIITALSDASYHFADDSGKSWGDAHARLNFAAKEVNRLRLDFTATHYLYRAKAQLVGFDDFINAVLKDARK